MNIVARHPTIRRDGILHFFLTSESAEVHARMKERYKNLLDEFVILPNKDEIEKQLNAMSCDVQGMKDELNKMLKSVQAIRYL